MYDENTKNEIIRNIKFKPLLRQNSISGNKLILSVEDRRK